MKKTTGIMMAIACAIVFGAYPAASRAVYADGGNASFMILLTTCCRAMALALFSVARGQKLFQTRTYIRQGFTGGFFQALSILCIFSSLAYLSGPLMIIILFSNTLMLLFFMAWKGEIKLDALTLLTTLGALVGLSFVLDVWHPQNLSLIGVGLALAAAVATMSRFYVYGKLTETRHPAVVGAEAFLFASLFVLVLGLFSTPQLPASLAGYGWAAASTMSLILGSFGVFYGISILGSFEFSLLGKLEPIFTAIFSVVFVHEYLSVSQYAGIGLVLASLAAYQYGTAKNK